MGLDCNLLFFQLMGLPVVILEREPVLLKIKRLKPTVNRRTSLLQQSVVESIPAPIQHLRLRHIVIAHSLEITFLNGVVHLRGVIDIPLLLYEGKMLLMALLLI